MSGHTPTPWRMAPPYLDIIYGSDQSVICREPNNPNNGKNWPADAALIVKAANSHAAMVKALEIILHDTHGIPDWQALEQCRSLARAALSQVNCNVDYRKSPP